MHLEIKQDGNDRRYYLDGQEIEGVLAAEIILRPRQPAEVRLNLLATIDFDGIAKVKFRNKGKLLEVIEVK